VDQPADGSSVDNNNSSNNRRDRSTSNSDNDLDSFVSFAQRALNKDSDSGAPTPTMVKRVVQVSFLSISWIPAL
jgi:hypothetical protein